MAQKSKLWQTIGISLFLRIALIVIVGMYENIQKGELFVTDIDYKVYSDSNLYPTPYGRHTYRYTPLLSYMMTLNYTVYESFGKIIFALFDALAIFTLWKIIAKVPSSASP